MFAAMFINIEPIAGCSAGTSGNSRRMIGRRPTRHPLHEAATLRQPHDAEPQRHDADQAERDRDRSLRTIERAVGDFLELVGPAADRDRKNDESRARCNSARGFIRRQRAAAKRDAVGGGSCKRARECAVRRVHAGFDSAQYVAVLPTSNKETEA